MNRILILLAALLLTTAAFAQLQSSYLPDYSAGVNALASTPGTYGGALGAFWNPAAWGAMGGWEAALSWSDRNVHPKRLDDWSLALGTDGIGFAMRSTYTPHPRNSLLFDRLNDYSLGVGGGDPDNYWGLSYNWSKGGSYQEVRDHYLTVGSIYRPFPFVSVGGTSSLTLDKLDYNATADVGLRPFSNHRVTFFGDVAAGHFEFNTPERMQYGVGVEVQPLNGLRAALKMSKPYAESQDKLLSLSIGASIDGLGFNVVPHFDKDQEHISTSYVARVGEQEPTIDPAKYFAKDDKLVTVGMKGVLTYQKEKIGAPYKIPLWPTLQTIEQAKRNPTVGGIALNLSGFNGGRELVWELREKLVDFKSAGKQVYIYFDNVGMTGYYLASVADYVWIDPQGGIVIPGFVAGRTFWKGFFEKIGLGVEEWRFFTYKSAFEAFSRKDMSAADKEQRLTMITDFYEQWLADIAASRGLTREQIEAGVDTMGIFTPDEALAGGLVDTVGRWDDVKDFAELLTGDKPGTLSVAELKKARNADPDWGKPPEIAVVYAVGECAMDTGIKGRSTSRTLRKLANNKHVKAVVLRADSPGGDALPSDLVAAEMDNISDSKPMIVTQGGVAGSGGYWISMNADRIYSSPFTVTGSIGVIGGWLWNDGLGSKTGFTSDYVKVGQHAEVGFGITLPFLGLTVPERNLDSTEHLRVERLIRGMYKQFTEKVADGRLLTASYVDSIGQGRVWSGKRALENGLVDEIGGMEAAIARAKSDAKLKPNARVKLVEYPKPAWINPALFGGPSVLTALTTLVTGRERPEGTTSPDYELSYWRKLSASGGKPLYMVSPEDIPVEDHEAGLGGLPAK
ncbi:S49 family peptidase [candidate division KSB1 bacterium]|nr:S49 family peptidase [candidate division KSB1 bacterium]